MQPKYKLNDHEHAVSPVRRSQDIVLNIDGRETNVRLNWHDRFGGEIVVDQVPHIFYAAQDDDRLFIHVDGKVWELSAIDDFGGDLNAGAAASSLLAPMPGVVVEVMTAIGEPVCKGDPLVIIESMKMQMEVNASVDGVIAAINYDAGDNFDKGALLVEFEQESDASG